ncbi:universal stress protein [Streptomyces andamanensis]|uniref:Universal stress protein n=1 Tax=Streptomyces andamanensis TaxID=1565035 RepID=A0ABV8TRD5_9ACTN
MAWPDGRRAARTAAACRARLCTSRCTTPRPGDRDAQRQRSARDGRRDGPRPPPPPPGLAVTTDLVEDEAAPALTARGADAEALVLGSRGQGALVGFLVGSVGQQVIAGARRPVVLVRAGDEPAAEAPDARSSSASTAPPRTAPRRCASPSRTAAARGRHRPGGARLDAAAGLRLQPRLAQLLDEAGGLEPYERKALTERCGPGGSGFPDVPVVEHVEMGSAGQVLLATAGHAQLVVVGRRARRTAVGARIGSVAHGVLHHAGCPVAVVPHE